MNNFDHNDFNECVNRGLQLLKNREEQMLSEGHEWPFTTELCRWAIEQQIINRAANVTMMSAVIGYVEKIEAEAETFNGLLA